MFWDVWWCVLSGCGGVVWVDVVVWFGWMWRCGLVHILHPSSPHASPLPSTSFSPPLHILHPSPPHASPLPSTSFSPPLHILHPPPHPSPLPSTSFTLLHIPYPSSPHPSPFPFLDVPTLPSTPIGGFQHFPDHERGRSQRDWCVNPWGTKEAPDSLRCAPFGFL